MDYLIDKYLKKPDYVKELFNKKVTVSLKIDGSAFQIFYNKDEDKIEYHKRGGSSSKLGPIIDEYTQLFTKHLNDAIDFFDNKKEILKENKFYAIEIFNNMYVLLNVIDNNDKVLTNVDSIAKRLDIESLPILLDNKTLSKESQEDLISMCTLKEDTTNETFILLIKKIFGSGDYEKFLKGDEIEGIVLTWIIDDKPVQYKIINPAFKTRHEKEQKDKLKEAEKDTEQLNKLIKLLYDRLSDVAKYRDDNWIKNLDLNFFEMCSDPNWLQDVKNIAKEITPNNNKWFMLQLNKISNIIKKLLDDNGDEIKTIYEKYLMTFNKPKKRAFIISKEFQTNINNIIEKLQSVKESLKLYTKINMKSIKQYISESQDKYFTEQEQGKIMKDIWNKNGKFYKMLKEIDIKADATNINQYFDDLLDDDRMLAGFAEYISKVIKRNNFSLEQVHKFVQTEDLKCIYEVEKDTASIYYMYNSSFDSKSLKEIDNIFNTLIKNIKENILSNETEDEDDVYYKKMDAHEKCVTFKNCSNKDWNKLKKFFEKFVKTNNHFNKFFNNYERDYLVIGLFPKPFKENDNTNIGLFLTLQKNYK